MENKTIYDDKSNERFYPEEQIDKSSGTPKNNSELVQYITKRTNGKLIKAWQWFGYRNTYPEGRQY